MPDIKVRHRYHAARERVFDAWLDPKLASRFAFATPDGEMIRADMPPEYQEQTPKGWEMILGSLETAL